MRIKTKTVSIIGISAILIGALIIAGYKIILPQRPDPETRLLGNNGFPKTVENVIKHISLFRQGIGFDILDNNQSRDATGVIMSGDLTKVNDDILTIEEKPSKQSIDIFLTNINKKAPKGCSYTIESRTGANDYQINQLRPSAGCKKEKGDVSELVYIYTPEVPNKVIKIEQTNKYAGPRSDTAKKILRFESIKFL